jgi:hypothetical protein
MRELVPLLARWSNFFVAMMQAAAALIGLLFVVIALGAQQGFEELGDAGKIRVYMTPTVVYFASILILSALLIFPNHTPLTAALCATLSGVGGLIYAGFSLIGNKKSYEARHDLIVYAIYPFAAYALLLVGGILLIPNARLGFTLVALGMLSLLTISVRNSWAIAIAVVRPGRR